MVHKLLLRATSLLDEDRLLRRAVGCFRVKPVTC